VGRPDGKVGGVRGTSKGLGREIVLHAVREGARLVTVARNVELGQAVSLIVRSAAEIPRRAGHSPEPLGGEDGQEHLSRRRC
jgi:NAD(P)-dependent dehydrogenase (short-subunit alcohol dehydrogenase family)